MQTKHAAARFKAGVSGARRCVVIANNHADVSTTSPNRFVSPSAHDRQSFRHAGKQLGTRQRLASSSSRRYCTSAT